MYNITTKRTRPIFSMPSISPSYICPRLLLRFQIIFVFAYAAIGIILSPEKYVKWLPHDVFFTPEHSHLAVMIFGFMEIALVLWVLFGKRADIAALVSATTLLLITAFNLDQIDILFRNVGLAAGAIALYFLEVSERKRLLKKNT